MFLKLVLLIYSIQHCKAFKFNKILSTTTTTRKEIQSEEIENWLAKPLLNIKYLHLKLRSNNFHQDVANSYTQWFLKQTLVPITISKYEMIDRNK